MKTYILGNCLRGFVEGKFKSQEEAWKWLSRRFMLSYPNSVGRNVTMGVVEKNPYGFEQALYCQNGVTYMGRKIPRDKCLKRCKGSYYKL